MTYFVGVSRAGELLISHVKRTVYERVHVVPVDQIDFSLSALGEDAGLIGAALWAQHRHEYKSQGYKE